MLKLSHLSGFGGRKKSIQTQWNAGDKGSNVTLSNGNLTAAYSTYTNSTVRADVGKASGKWYWEITIDSLSATAALNIGLAQTPLGQGSLNLFGTAGVWRAWSGGQLVAAGNVLSFEFDASGATGTLVVKKNNVTQATITGLSLSNPWYPALSDDNTGANATYTANFGNSPFVYGPSAGFTAGIY